MARLLGFISNRPDLGARAVELEGRALSVRKRAGVTPGWGVGFYPGCAWVQPGWVWNGYQWVWQEGYCGY